MPFFARVGIVVLVMSLLAMSPRAHAGGKGFNATVQGALLTAPDGKPLAAATAVPAGQTAVVLGKAEIASGNGAVKVYVVGNIGDLGPLPSLEAAVRLHESDSADLDLTLERGIIVLANERKSGPAQVHLRLFGERLEVTLQEPGTKLGIDAYSRNVPGRPVTLKDEPIRLLFFLCLEGRAQVANQDKAVVLKSPPGPAQLHWDSLVRQPEVHHLDKLPDWVNPKANESHRKSVAMAAAKLATADAVESARELLRDTDPVQRKVGVTALGALDRPFDLVAALGDARADVRGQAILVLRHWLGRQPGQTLRLAAALKKSDFRLPQIATVTHLLLGFDEEELQRPATYQMLIGLLGHSRPAIRELAHWHLVRLEPEGRTIPFDAAIPVLGTSPAIDAWRRLIPPGELPGKKR